MAYAERIRQAAHGTGRQAKLPERLGDLDQETLTPSHAPSYLSSDHPAVLQRFRSGVGEALDDGEPFPDDPRGLAERPA